MIFHNQNNRFYTYAYLREDRTPYYIGKGCGRRAFKPHGKIPVPAKARILFLKRNLTEKEAFKHEIYLIAVFGRKDLGTGILLNFTNGGEGHSGYIQSPEHIERRVRNLRGKKRPKEVGEKISAAKTGSALSEEHKASISATLTGHTQSEETKKKRNAALRGKKRSDATKQKLSELARKRPQQICPHCGTVCKQPVNYNRWHGDNCKYK